MALTQQYQRNPHDKVLDVAVLLDNKTALEALPVLYLAQKHLRSRYLRGPLEGWDVALEWRDTGCSAETATYEAVEMNMLGQADVFMGPSCSYSLAPVCRFAANRWRTPVLSPGGKAEAFNETPKYPSLIRLNGHYTELADMVVQMCQRWNWNLIGLLFEDAEHGMSECHHFMSELNLVLRALNVTIVHAHFKTLSEISDAVEKMGNLSRVVAVCASTASSRRLLLRSAAEQGLSGGGEHLFLNVDLDAGPAAFYRPWGEDPSSTPAQFAPVLTLASRPQTSPRYQAWEREVFQIARDSSHKELSEKLSAIRKALGETDTAMLHKSKLLVSPYIASFYDGLMFYVEALNRTLARNSLKEPDHGDIKHQTLQEIRSGTFFSELKNESITIRNGTISDEYYILNLNISSHKYKEVATYRAGVLRLTEPEVGILWPGRDGTQTDRVPRDIPECGFQNELCEGPTYLVWLVAVLLLLLVLLVLLTMLTCTAIRQQVLIRLTLKKILGSTVTDKEKIPVQHVTLQDMPIL